MNRKIKKNMANKFEKTRPTALLLFPYRMYEKRSSKIDYLPFRSLNRRVPPRFQFDSRSFKPVNGLSSNLERNAFPLSSRLFSIILDYSRSSPSVISCRNRFMTVRTQRPGSLFETRYIRGSRIFLAVDKFARSPRNLRLAA